jgi:uncharacterized membrane protein
MDRRAAAAAGIAGLFATCTVAGAVYELVPAPLALATGAVATALALRWRAPGIAALGIAGAQLAPALAAPYDLAALSSICRVASFIVLGLLLLGGALAWQRMRPRPIPDFRAMPEALR